MLRIQLTLKDKLSQLPKINQQSTTKTNNKKERKSTLYKLLSSKRSRSSRASSFKPFKKNFLKIPTNMKMGTCETRSNTNASNIFRTSQENTQHTNQNSSIFNALSSKINRSIYHQRSGIYDTVEEEEENSNPYKLKENVLVGLKDQREASSSRRRGSYKSRYSRASKKGGNNLSSIFKAENYASQTYHEEYSLPIVPSKRSKKSQSAYKKRLGRSSRSQMQSSRKKKTLKGSHELSNSLNVSVLSRKLASNKSHFKNNISTILKSASNFLRPEDEESSVRFEDSVIISHPPQAKKRNTKKSPPSAFNSNLKNSSLILSSSLRRSNTTDKYQSITPPKSRKRKLTRQFSKDSNKLQKQRTIQSRQHSLTSQMHSPRQYTSKSLSKTTHERRKPYQQYEFEIKRKLKILNYPRVGFEEEGPQKLKNCNNQCHHVKNMLSNLMVAIRKRKTQRVMVHSLELAEFILSTQLPTLIIVTLDYLIPFLMLLNEIRLTKKYSEDLLHYSRKINDTYGKLRGCQYKAFYYRKTGDYVSALKRYFKMLKYCLKTKDYRNEVQAYGLIGLCYYYKGDIEKALPFEERAVSGKVEPEESRHRLVLDKQGRKVKIENRMPNRKLSHYGKMFNSQIYGRATYEQATSDSEAEEITLYADYNDVNDSDKLIDMTPGQKQHYLRNRRQLIAQFIAEKNKRLRNPFKIPGMDKYVKDKASEIQTIFGEEKQEKLENGNFIHKGVVHITPYPKNDEKKFKGAIFSDKRIISLAQLSPLKNKERFDDLAQLKSKTYSSKCMNKFTDISMRQRTLLADGVRKIARKNRYILKTVADLQKLYFKLEQSYCVPLFYFDNKIKHNLDKL